MLYFSYMLWAQKQKGFTIVELLIVIVVIAILAAIVIVAYNGIQDRAKNSAAQSATAQAAKRIQQYFIENGDTYPVDQAAFDALNLSNSSASYQYTANNSSNPKTFCLTATVQNKSYYINNSTQTSPAVGGCNGHGRGGIAAITNLSTDPRATSYSAAPGSGRIAWSNARASGTYALITGASDGPNGIQTYIRKTMQAVTNGNDGFSNSGTTGGTSAAGTGIPVSAGETYTVSAWVRHSSATTKRFQVKFWWLSENGDRISVTEPNNTLAPVNTWTRVSTTATVPSNVTRLATLIEGASGGGKLDCR